MERGSRPALSYVASATGLRGLSLSGLVTALRVRDTTGELAGTALVIKPLAGMSVLATVTAGGDLQHCARMQRVAEAARRPAAMLFADLEGSSALARRLSTTNYFTLGRRLVAAADQCVVDAGGVVGRHVGDGVVAYFLAARLARSRQPREPASPPRARCAPPWRTSPRVAGCAPRTSSCASGCTGAPVST